MRRSFSSDVQTSMGSQSFVFESHYFVVTVYEMEHSRAFGIAYQINNGSWRYSKLSWFARVVAALMLMVKNKLNHFTPLGTKLFLCVNSSREKNSIVLTLNMAALSRGCKPSISGVSWCGGNHCWLAIVLWCGYFSLPFQFFSTTSFNFFLAFRSRGNGVKRCDIGKQREGG